MAPDDVERQRAANLWEPLGRKLPPIGKATRLTARPEIDLDRIGGLDEPKDEILTYACAATDPAIYQRWGTVPPTGLLLVGPAECGKSLLAEALALRTETPFLRVSVPRLVLQILHAPNTAGAVLEAWSDTLRDMPALTVFFREIEFSHVQSLVGRRGDVPVWPMLDFIVELLDRTFSLESTVVVGSTSHPGTLSPAFLEPGRFERIVSVNPVIPDDIVAALRVHAGSAEERAGRKLFHDVDWTKAVPSGGGESIGEWLRILHAVLRRKARCEAAQESPAAVTTDDLIEEFERSKKTAARLPSRTGTYL